MSQPKLFTPIRVGDMMLSHRVILAPLTRFRADDEHVHHEIAVEYYSQRATTPGTLLISEAVLVSPEAGGYDNVPGIWNERQIAAWKKVVDAVHKRGSYIFLQLWAIGRAADPRVLEKEGYSYVSSSPSLLERPGYPNVTPRELSKSEIKQYVENYARAARNAVYEAGFDGVEIHAANGYLIDQFNQDVCNKRTDEYGGSVENRTRFTFEVLEPGLWLDRREDESRDMDSTTGTFNSNDFARLIWQPRPFFSAGGFKPESAFVEAETKDTCVVIGRYFISNPDLPERLRRGIPLSPYNRGTFYTPGPKAAKGYIDYPQAAH
ncbi:NADH:flavin oxidoreductase/NADH oxidase [Rhizoctonia solani]|uniref:NADH:flavin oxidoreductase/NADH oxidase n=1 Tax=Rhizoctonia solani TaxID=456999 RepID=A0A8H8SY75_9AGAM|nr:NADH:flavin oxidoreductase/NADH oxidase [Rhizoctonia solani]QRW21058.1 NADH:flavin oxidoreductase/NADH oxidase [Rhizoctonia solani]